MNEQNNELFFVQLKQPSEVRKNILETLREILEILQKFEKFKRLRHEKLENVNKLSNLLKETNKMFGALKLRMPQTSLRTNIARQTAPQTKKIVAKKKKKDATAKKPVKRHISEVEKLETELSAIEGKLKGLI